MKPTDSQAFCELLSGVHAFYRQDFSTFAASVWWEGMKPFDFEAVRDAMNRHAVNPDNGQFLPKPADIVKLLGGTNLDRATLAWTQVQRAVHHVGTYESVCFDDPIVNAVIHEMGGWIGFGTVPEKELPFKQKEFEQRYRAYRTQGGTDDYPSVLPGIIERDNVANGYAAPGPKLIGDPKRAAMVHGRGGEGRQLTVTPLVEAVKRLPGMVAA